jgi:hypothetical protein
LKNVKTGYENNIAILGGEQEKERLKEKFDTEEILVRNVNLKDLTEEERLIERDRIASQKGSLTKYEVDRLALLKLEREKELNLKYEGIKYTNKILKEENRAVMEVRENEARLFRSYAKKEDNLLKNIHKD